MKKLTTQDFMDWAESFNDSEEIAESIKEIGESKEDGYPYWENEAHDHIINMWELVQQMALHMKRLQAKLDKAKQK